jgi:acetyl esterase/lipase
MRRTLLTLFLALCLTLASGLALQAEDQIVPIQITRDVIYGHKMGMALTFDVLRPSESNGAGVLFMVSGGWFSRHSPAERSAQRFRTLLEAGFTVFPVRHGSAPLFKVPEAVADVRRATRYIHLHAAEFGVDAERLGVWGGSAGGHLSLMLGNTGDDGNPEATDPIERGASHIAAVVAYFPPVDLTGLTGPNERFPALDFDLELIESVSPIFHVSADDPPSLMIHGDKDDLVPLTHSERILASFQEAGVTTNLIVLPGAGHGFRDDDAVTAGKHVVEWFTTHLVPSEGNEATGG